MILAGCVPIGTVLPATTESTGGAAVNVRGLLARQLHLDPAAVKVTRATAAEWPDACLGTAAEDEICAQVVTPGFELTYEIDSATYRYQSDPKSYRDRPVEAPPPAIGGTVIAWTGRSDEGACRTAEIGPQGWPSRRTAAYSWAACPVRN